MTFRLTALAGCAILGACASAPEGPPPPRAELNVFISPSGEPFRGGATGAYPLDVWFNRADTNHDGALSPEEFVADAVTFFHSLDTNHDGVVDGFEIAAYEQNIAPEILPRIARLTARDIAPLPGTAQSAHDIAESGRPMGRRSRGVTGAASFSLTPEPEPVSAADTDFDGKVSLAETIAAARRHFATLDKDKDGRLLRSELPATPAERLAIRAQGKGRGRALRRE